MQKTLIFLVLIIATLALVGGSAHSEMIIKLKSGKIHRLPVAPEEIDSIKFQDQRASKKKSASRAARKAPPLADEAKAGTPQIIRVGPKRIYKTPSAVAKVAKARDVIEIDAAVYQGDVAIWRQNGLTLRGVGGRPHLKAEGNSAQGKAIWVIRGNDVTVENIEFSGARVRDKNGAGIRVEGRNLIIRNSYFHDNEMGILGGSRNPDSEILIEGCEFARNIVDHPKRLGHNIYIGRVRRFTLRSSYVHHAHIGHNVKSRARENYILYNRIMDETGGSSYLVDLPEGGHAYLIGNLFHQSPRNDNPNLVSFSAEKNRDKPDQLLYVINNTFVNEDKNGVFVNNHSAAAAKIANNIFAGNGRLLSGPGELSDNLVTDDAGLKDRDAYDYRLRTDSSAIDKGTDPGQAEDGFPLQPKFQYIHPHAIQPRPVRGEIDIGAYEFSEK